MARGRNRVSGLFRGLRQNVPPSGFSHCAIAHGHRLRQLDHLLAEIGGLQHFGLGAEPQQFGRGVPGRLADRDSRNAPAIGIGGLFKLRACLDVGLAQRVEQFDAERREPHDRDIGMHLGLEAQRRGLPIGGEIEAGGTIEAVVERRAVQHARATR